MNFFIFLFKNSLNCLSLELLNGMKYLISSLKYSEKSERSFSLTLFITDKNLILGSS